MSPSTLAPLGRRVVVLTALAIGVCNSHLSAAPQGRVEVAGTAGFFDNFDFDGKHYTVGAAGRIYWNDRWSFAPAFERIRGFDEPGPVEFRHLHINPCVAVDLSASNRFRPYLVGGVGFVRYTLAFTKYDESHKGINLGFGADARLFLTERLFVSPEVRIGVPVVHASFAAGYVVRAGRPRPPPRTRSVDAAGAMRPPRFEIAPGFGHAFGGGTDTGPNLWMPHAGATLWIGDRLGIAYSFVRGIGQDLSDEPVRQPGRGPIIRPPDYNPYRYEGWDGLRFHRLTLRYRRPIAGGTGFEIGAGAVFAGRFRALLSEQRGGPVSSSRVSDFGGFSVDLFVTRRLASHLVLKSGAAFDLDFLPLAYWLRSAGRLVETSAVRPLVELAVVF